MGKERAMQQQQRCRFKQLLSLTERLDQEAARLRAQAETLSHGPERDSRIRRARQAETATHVDEWLSSPGLERPR
jgi:hypothetical protein